MEYSISALRIAFLLQRERLGRRRLAERAGLSEMTVRLELDRLRSQGFVQLDRSGCALTDEGLRTFSPVLNLVVKVAPLDLSGLRIDVISLAAHLRIRQQSPAAWQLRDEAIREGASGLIMLVQSNGEWIFTHDQEPVRVQYLNDAEQLEQTFPEVNPSDLVVIVPGPDERVCAQGLWRVILNLATYPR